MSETKKKPAAKAKTAAKKKKGTVKPKKGVPASMRVEPKEEAPVERQMTVADAFRLILTELNSSEDDSTAMLDVCLNIISFLHENHPLSSTIHVESFTHGALAMAASLSESYTKITSEGDSVKAEKPGIKLV